MKKVPTILTGTFLGVCVAMAALAAVVWAAPAIAGGKGVIVGGNAYPLDTCVVSGQKLGSMGSPVEHEHKGRAVLFCCKGCVSTFEKNTEKYLAKLDKAVIKNQIESYPLDTCLVRGGKLGSMGKPVDHVYQNRLVRFCCKGCIAGFEKQAKKHLERLNAAVVEKQLPSYKAETCPVSGKKLGSMGEPVNFIHNNRLIRLCCKGCIKAVDKDPAKYLAKVAGGI